MEQGLRLAMVPRRSYGKLHTPLSGHQSRAERMEGTKPTTQSAHRIIVKALEHGAIVQDNAITRAYDARAESIEQ
ncbi:hypothetical protein ACVWXN_006776 [Bradyrhizobium sp. i1.4.4]